MTDIESKRLIVGKGVLFMLTVVLSAVGLVCYCPRWEAVVLVLILMWASARSYYFLFYVLEKYVDPRLKYSGIVDLIRNMRR